jgi:hypothetical protein
MRGYVERMERLQQFADEGVAIDHDDVIESWLHDDDAARDEAKHG